MAEKHDEKDSRNGEESSRSDIVCHMPKCGKRFQTTRFLRIHMRDSHGMSEFEINSVMYHLGWTSMNGPTKKFACSTNKCGKLFPTSEILRKHMRESHERPKSEMNKVMYQLSLTKEDVAEDMEDTPAKRMKTENPAIDKPLSKDETSHKFTSDNSKLVNLAENILGSMEKFFLSKNQSNISSDQNMETLEEEPDLIERKLAEMFEEKDPEGSKMILKDEKPEEKIDWVDKVEGKVMRAGTLFHCSECKFIKKDESVVVDHVQVKHSLHWLTNHSFRAPTSLTSLASSALTRVVRCEAIMSATIAPQAPLPRLPDISLHLAKVHTKYSSASDWPKYVVQ